jgi:transcriptional regulator with XRE-family HTH domain
MISSSDMTKTIHQGRNVKRFREMLQIKQEGLAYELGDDWTQKRVSLLEQKEVIEQDILDQIARILKVPSDAIKNFDEEQAINIISNTFHDTNGLVNYNPTFNINPIDKWIEALEENKKLYERLLQAEQEKNQLLQRLLDGK